MQHSDLLFLILKINSKITVAFKVEQQKQLDFEACVIIMLFQLYAQLAVPTCVLSVILPVQVIKIIFKQLLYFKNISFSFIWWNYTETA